MEQPVHPWAESSLVYQCVCAGCRPSAVTIHQVCGLPLLAHRGCVLSAGPSWRTRRRRGRPLRKRRSRWSERSRIWWWGSSSLRRRPRRRRKVRAGGGAPLWGLSGPLSGSYNTSLNLENESVSVCSKSWTACVHVIMWLGEHGADGLYTQVTCFVNNMDDEYYSRFDCEPGRLSICLSSDVICVYEASPFVIF